ncbi:COX15/CtaA family protein [Hyphomicrobium sp.]|uniref:COX15/CtaA family protein n=1 Tax=Hyphomicrobium sp. TaxID=82 RepID=UPI000FC0B946|nr:COX15/CtaA family protein [Hyphomicrobium sp.]RUO98021.1 MAG: heme A synthase [Hyphomicrobium sp.]
MTMMQLADNRQAMAAEERDGGRRAVSVWLWIVAALVFAMVVVGGATRLTESGLSITEWQPLLGAIPPLNEADWMSAFDKYKQIPQYHALNQGMTLDEFKFIYYWEWSHRLLGRAIGVVFALPFLYFWWTRKLKRGTGMKFLGILALGGLQGFIGWYMVSSGLSERIEVSQYRLALHLTTAFMILGLLVWAALEEWPGVPRVTGEVATPVIRRMAPLIVTAVLVQVVLGAFVAGLRAGYIYNTWPSMNGQFVPSDYWLKPAYLSFFESHAATQFNHRMMAYFVAFLSFLQIWLTSRSPVDDRIRLTAQWLGAAVVMQIALGIFTLLSHVRLDLGLMHQGGGAVVFVLAVVHLHATRRAGIVPRDFYASRGRASA